MVPVALLVVNDNESGALAVAVSLPLPAIYRVRRRSGRGMAPKEQNSKPSLRMTMAGWEELVRHSDTRVKSDYGRVEEAESLNTLIRTAELCNGQMSFAQLAAPAAEVIAISRLL